MESSSIRIKGILRKETLKGKRYKLSDALAHMDALPTLVNAPRKPEGDGWLSASELHEKYQRERGSISIDMIRRRMYRLVESGVYEQKKMGKFMFYREVKGKK